MTNAEYYAKMTVVALRKRLRDDFGMVGTSTMKKAELVSALAVLMDGAHIDALEINTPPMADDWEIEHSASVDAFDQERQLSDWWIRHGLERPVATASDIVNARNRDHMEALALNYLLTVVARNKNRLAGYASQRGKNKSGGVSFSPAQRRRFLKKMRHANKTFAEMSA